MPPRGSAGSAVFVVVCIVVGVAVLWFSSTFVARDGSSADGCAFCWEPTAGTVLVNGKLESMDNRVGIQITSSPPSRVANYNEFTGGDDVASFTIAPRSFALFGCQWRATSLAIPAPSGLAGSDSPQLVSVRSGRALGRERGGQRADWGRASGFIWPAIALIHRADR